MICGGGQNKNASSSRRYYCRRVGRLSGPRKPNPCQRTPAGSGKVKEKWGKLTDDDLTAIAGQRDQLEGRLQERYGYAKDQARKDVDTWFSTLK